MNRLKDCEFEMRQISDASYNVQMKTLLEMIVTNTAIICDKLDELERLKAGDNNEAE